MGSGDRRQTVKRIKGRYLLSGEARGSAQSKPGGSRVRQNGRHSVRPESAKREAP